jgi:rare lipoprotein A
MRLASARTGAALWLGLLAGLGEAAAARADVDREDAPPPAATAKGTDLSGRARVGVASVYAYRFAGRKMADGRRMDPRDGNAASRTLPLGTEARVTNLGTGQSARVVIEDRGPYVKGRIVDLSPATAEQIGITQREGIAKVEVAPIAVPQPDGSVKPGAAAMDPKR